MGGPALPFIIWTGAQTDRGRQSQPLQICPWPIKMCLVKLKKTAEKNFWRREERKTTLISAHQGTPSELLEAPGTIKALVPDWVSQQSACVSLLGRRLSLCAAMVTGGMSRSSRSRWVTHRSPFPTVPQHVQRSHPAALPQRSAALHRAIVCCRTCSHQEMLTTFWGATAMLHTDGREPGMDGGQLASQ